jgi:hypothetical protein
MLSQQKKNPKREKKSPKNMRNMWIEIWVSYYVWLYEISYHISIIINSIPNPMLIIWYHMFSSCPLTCNLPQQNICFRSNSHLSNKKIPHKTLMFGETSICASGVKYNSITFYWPEMFGHLAMMPLTIPIIPGFGRSEVPVLPPSSWDFAGRIRKYMSISYTVHHITGKPDCGLCILSVYIYNI